GVTSDPGKALGYRGFDRRKLGADFSACSLLDGHLLEPFQHELLVGCSRQAIHIARKPVETLDGIDGFFFFLLRPKTSRSIIREKGKDDLFISCTDALLAIFRNADQTSGHDGGRAPLRTV